MVHGVNLLLQRLIMNKNGTGEKKALAGKVEMI